MFCEQRNSFSHLVSYCILLTIIILLGDKLASMLSQSGELWRALVDNATHGAVGALSWAVVELPGLQINKWLLCVLCGLLSSCIDLDHFWQAKSLYLHVKIYYFLKLKLLILHFKLITDNDKCVCLHTYVHACMYL